MLKQIEDKGTKDPCSPERFISDLFKVHELQRIEQIHACMLLGGMDDQDPQAWNDTECIPTGDLNTPVAIVCSTDSDDEGDLESMDEGEGESG